MSTEADNISLFMSASIRAARSLPLTDAVKYLHGLLLSCSDTDATRHLRKIYTQLSEADRQLELLAEGRVAKPKPKS